MPRRKIMRKRPIRRRAKKAPRRIRNMNHVPNGAAPIARRHIVKLKYNEVVAWSVPTLTTSAQQYNLNNIFDPNETGSGHQPYGFDQLAALFQRYRVYKCTWHIEFGGSSDRLISAVVPLNNTSPSTSIEAVAEMPLAMSRAHSYNGGPPARYKGKAYLPKLAGVTPLQYKIDDRWSATVGSGPLELMRLYIAVYNPTLSTVSTTATITLMFYTEFYDPIQVGQS